MLELIILGGGCAGLSLAYQLATRAADPPSTLIIEARPTYQEDRTWCGWPLEPHAFDDCVIARWSRWGLENGEHRANVRSSIAYEMIDAGRFYDTCLGAIATHERLTLRTGTRVDALVEYDDHVAITLDSGETLSARQVITTLPTPKRLNAPWRWQDFAGWVIDTPKIGALAQAELMNFSVTPAPTSDTLAFVYTLPIDERHALVEWTSFARAPVPLDQLEQALAQHVAERFGEVDVLRRECGSLPMAPAWQRGSARIHPAGTAGGAMRPATGYAFHAIQRWARECREALEAGQPPSPPARSKGLEWLDRTFMTALSRHAALGPDCYVRLFDRLPAERVIRFLAGQPTALDVARVMTALPLAPFLESAARTLTAPPQP
ncbi:lycopene cyclase family protein [Larsenimonas salina]|uniref:lycopene cyclase family protein n=1 Tax=Larsenimonas salina TaxID=1295565 RepID=UPI0020734D51|nr:lycopene cyclase family protein [Larsenimonas salina]MCM5703088.1 lycopene cyclase family protein [Larsenimonas salina]